MRRVGIVLFFFLGSWFPRAAAETVEIAIFPSDDTALNQSPILPLVETELSRDPSIHLLERAEVERILTERKIQLSLGEDLRSRSRIGDLLRAELLVSLEPEQGAETPLLRLALIRTRDGLRVSSTFHHWDTEDPEATAGEIAETVARLAERSMTEVAPIVSVFPFIGKDLLHTYDSLQDSLPAIVQERLSHHLEILPIEIEEAEKIAAELQLTGGGSVNREELPFFISGAYKNTIEEGSRTIFVDLQLLQGGQTLAEEGSGPISPEEIYLFLERSAESFGNRISNAGFSEQDRVQDAQTLARQGYLLHQRGEHEKALAHYEAALLVLPEAKVYHRRAMDLCTVLMTAYFEGEFKDHPDHFEKGLRFALRHLDHYERYLYSIPPSMFGLLGSSRFNSVGQVLQRFRFYNRKSEPSPQLLKLLREYSDRNDRIRHDYLMSLHKRDILSENFLSHEFGVGAFKPQRHFHDWLDPAIRNERQKEFFAMIDSYSFGFSIAYQTLEAYHREKELSDIDLDFLQYIENYDSAKVRLALRLHRAMQKPVDTPGLLEEFEDIQEEVNSILGPRVNLPIGERLRELASLQGPHTAPTAKAPSFPEPTPEPTDPLWSLQLKSIHASLGYYNEHADIPLIDWEPADEGSDIAATLKGVCRVFGPERYERVYSASGESKVLALLPDRDSIWVLVSGPETQVLRWDRELKALEAYGSEIGLPPSDRELRGIVFRDGHLILVGYFGRTWLGELNLNSDGKVSFEVTFQAANEVGGTSDIQTAFRPSNIWLDQSKEDEPAQTVVISRWFQDLPSRSHYNTGREALAYSPDTKEVRLVSDRYGQARGIHQFALSKEGKELPIDSPERRRLVQRQIAKSQYGAVVFEDLGQMIKIDRTGGWIYDGHLIGTFWRELGFESNPLRNPHQFSGTMFESSLFGHVLYAEQKVFQVQLVRAGES